MTRAEGVWGSEVSLPGVIPWPSRPRGAAGASVGGKVKVAAVVGRFWLGMRWGRSTRGGWSNRGYSSIPSFSHSSFPPFLLSLFPSFLSSIPAVHGSSRERGGFFCTNPKCCRADLGKASPSGPLLREIQSQIQICTWKGISRAWRESCGKAWLVLCGELRGLLLVAPGFCFPINSPSKTVSQLFALLGLQTRGVPGVSWWSRGAPHAGSAPGGGWGDGWGDG